MYQERGVYSVNDNYDTEYVKPYHHPVPPYGLPLGPPYIIAKQSVLYSDNDIYLNRQSRWKFIKRLRLERQLQKCFPLIFVLTHSGCLILNSVIQIILQIILMSLNGALWFVAAGIWCGVYFLVTAGFTLLLARNRKNWTLILSYIFHLIGILMAIGAYLVVNLLAIAEYSNENCASNLYGCFNSNMKTVNYLMFFIGVICIIQLLLYLVLMPFYIIDYPNIRRKYKMEKEIKSHYPNDIQKHSTLYAQENLE